MTGGTARDAATCPETCTCDPVACDDLDSDDDMCSPGCAVCTYGCPLGDDCPLDVPWAESFAAHRPSEVTS